VPEEKRDRDELSLLRASRSMFMRDITLALRRKADVLTSLFFFLIVVTLFPLGIGPEMNTLREIAPGVIWVAALLASMLSLGRMFSDDHQDGTLEQFLILPQPLTVMVLSKIVSHWFLSGLPLVFLSPLLGMQLGLDADAIMLLMGTLLLGTPAMSLIGGVGAALTVGVRGGGVLISLLVLPLFIPILIFGAGAVDAASAGLEVSAHLSLLGAFLIVSLIFAPLATAAALRISLE
jgi:heme exporter protein B